MKTRLHIFFPGIVIAAMLPLLGGCYTQLETMESAYDENEAVEDTVVAEAEEDFERDYPPPDYYLTFSYYHPGFTVLYSPYDPWDYWYYPGPVWYSPWYPPYYPVYSCWPYYPYGYYPYYYPAVYYGNGGSGGGYYPGGGGGSQTRDFGNSRGLGDGTGTRGRGGIVGRTGGDDASDPITALPASISRPTRQSGSTVSGGKKTESPQRRGTVNRPPTRKVQQESAPVTRGNTGSSRTGSDRGSVSSPPRSSPPSPPSNSSSRGSSGGGSRSGSPRSR